MFLIDKFDAHFDLMHKMAETSGVTLDRTLDQDFMGAQKLRSALLRCAACSCVDECKSYLAENDGKIAGPMPNCPNASFMRDLA